MKRNRWASIAWVLAAALYVGGAQAGDDANDVQQAIKDSYAAKEEFAIRYTAAWCSQNPASVAAFFAENGSLKINEGAPSVGRAAITEAAKSFMTAFPDLVVEMDGLEHAGQQYRYRWTLTGTHSGPGGSGRNVRITGYEEWIFGPDGLIAESLGHFDAADYDRQIGKASAAR